MAQLKPIDYQISWHSLKPNNYLLSSAWGTATTSYTLVCLGIINDNEIFKAQIQEHNEGRYYKTKPLCLSQIIASSEQYPIYRICDADIYRYILV